MTANNKHLMRTDSNLKEIMARNNINESSNDLINTWITYPKIERFLFSQL